MKSGIIIADIMTRNPLTISPETSLLDCAKRMLKKKVGSFPIIDKDKILKGFISQKDILWAIIKKSEKGLKAIKVKEISVRKITTINPKASVKEALKKMKKYRRLPVVQKGKLVGLITRRDILNFEPEFYPEFEEIEQIREESEKLKRLKGQRSKEGICEECGNYSILNSDKGVFICEECLAK